MFRALASLFVLVSSAGVLESRAEASPPPRTIAAYTSEFQRFSADYTAIQRLGPNTREILDRSNAFMSRYNNWTNDAPSKPISGCTRNLSRDSRGEVSGFIWPTSGEIRSSLLLQFRAPASLDRVFTDDQICIEGQVTRFDCKSSFGVNFPGTPSFSQTMSTFINRLVAPHEARDAMRSSPMPSATYGLNLRCTLEVNVTSARFQR